MNTSTPSTGLRGLIAAGTFGALALSVNAVGAADFSSASVTVRDAEAMQQVRVTTVMRHVSYSDLDIATYSGATEFRKRVRDVVQMACKQLDELYPLEQKSAPECISKAMADASLRVDAAIAAAEREAKSE